MIITFLIRPRLRAGVIKVIHTNQAARNVDIYVCTERRSIKTFKYLISSYCFQLETIIKNLRTKGGVLLS